MNEKKVTVPRGIRNNNPLNIRKGACWKGLVPDAADPDFCKFQSMTMGCRAALRLMINHITGYGGRRIPAKTLYKLIAKWAPPSENNTFQYAYNVAKACDMDVNMTLNPRDKSEIKRIFHAMCVQENGQDIDDSYVESAWNLL